MVRLRAGSHKLGEPRVATERASEPVWKWRIDSARPLNPNVIVQSRHQAMGTAEDEISIPRRRASFTLWRLLFLVAVFALFFAAWRATWLHEHFDTWPGSTYQWEVRSSKIPFPAVIINTEQEARFDTAAEVRIYVWLGGDKRLLCSYPIAPIPHDRSLSSLQDLFADETRTLKQHQASSPKVVR